MPAGHRAASPRATSSRRLAWLDDGWLGGCRRSHSPNFDARPLGVAIDSLVIHFISLPAGRFSGDAISRLFENRLDRDPDPALVSLAGLRVSSHFLIRRRGELLQFVSCDDRAWHAGASRLLERQACNDFSIGVELEGDEYHRFTEPQYRRLSALVAVLRQRYPLRHVAGHSDIAPGRKIDPGPFFDWPRFLAAPGVAGLSRPGPDEACNHAGSAAISR
ncbi:MAG: 1,6-anhydro-N-acetylmuramyl-L-alanine amidase AmpD [Burkholderiaceae bacterium]|nr:1,6-anhydro-N-acetylmuramyl-L-alanine amidase AmpD [Burkholderiaceae bacterium]